MTQEIKPDYDFGQTDSRVIIEVRATKREHLMQRRGDDDRPEYGSEDVYYESEGHLRYDVHLGLSLVNIDAYMDPDYLADYPSEIETNDGTQYFTGYADVTIRFDAYSDEIRAAARHRAWEDKTHAVNVLAGWLWQVGGGTRYIKANQSHVFYHALREEIESCGEETPDWALAYDGTSQRWPNRYDSEPVTTLEEARIYATEGFGPVKEARDDE